MKKYIFTCICIYAIVILYEPTLELKRCAYPLNPVPCTGCLVRICLRRFSPSYTTSPLRGRNYNRWMLLPVRVLIVAVSWIFQPKIAVLKMVVMYVKCVDEVKNDLLHLRYIQIAYN